MSKTIFVTVGTTLFEALIEAVVTEEALLWMSRHGYTDLIIQYGKGQKPKFPMDDEKSRRPVRVECYDFKATLADDMKRADLIIGHAGAGTVSEVLQLKKRMVVVINTLLMDNHQTELANAMGERHHLYVVDCPAKMQDVDTWEAFEAFVPITLEDGDDEDFPRLLNSFFGFVSSKDQ